VTVRARPLAALALLLVLPATAPLAAEAPDPAAAARAIDDLHATLLDVMKNAEKLGFEGRVDRLAPALHAHYDFAFMAEKSVGRGWKDLDAEQRKELVDAFARLAIATYAARFDGYDGEHFETLGTQPATHDTLLVRTRIVRPNEEPVELDYRMRPSSDGWSIIDVFLSGTVSELALRRAEYSSVLKREGFDGLMAALEKKIAAQAHGEGEQSLSGI